MISSDIFTNISATCTINHCLHVITIRMLNVNKLIHHTHYSSTVNYYSRNIRNTTRHKNIHSAHLKFLVKLYFTAATLNDPKTRLVVLESGIGLESRLESIFAGLGLGLELELKRLGLGFETLDLDLDSDLEVFFCKSFSSPLVTQQ